MPLAMPKMGATASASSTISSWVSTRSPSASRPTLHFTVVSSPSAQGGQQRGQLLQAVQVVSEQQQAHVRRTHNHAQRAGREVFVVAFVRVEPDQPVALAGQPLS